MNSIKHDRIHTVVAAKLSQTDSLTDVIDSHLNMPYLAETDGI